MPELGPRVRLFLNPNSKMTCDLPREHVQYQVPGPGMYFSRSRLLSVKYKISPTTSCSVLLFLYFSGGGMNCVSYDMCACTTSDFVCVFFWGIPLLQSD